jgi:hypothetical protein
MRSAHRDAAAGGAQADGLSPPAGHHFASLWTPVSALGQAFEAKGIKVITGASVQAVAVLAGQLGRIGPVMAR